MYEWFDNFVSLLNSDIHAWIVLGALYSSLCELFEKRHVLVYLSSTADKHKHNSFFLKSVFAKTSALSCQATLLSAQTKSEPFTFQHSIAERKHVDWIKHSLVFNLKLLYYPVLSAWKRLNLLWFIDLRSHRLHSVVEFCNVLQKMFSDLQIRFEVLGYMMSTTSTFLKSCMFVCTLVLINLVMNIRSDSCLNCKDKLKNKTWYNLYHCATGA